MDYVFSHTKVQTTENGALITPFLGKNSVLIYQGKHLFSMKDRTTISHAFYRTADGELLLTDGFKTIKKVSGLKIISLAGSLLLGLFGLVYVFLVGCINLIKHKIHFRNHPLFWIFISILTMIFSFIFIASQSFMELGDLTFGNILLTVATCILPLALVLGIVRYIRSRHECMKIDLLTMVLLLQWVILLTYWGLIPFRLWIW